MTPNPQLQGKCTSCQKTWWLTAEQMREAQQVGVPFSPCCQVVATIVKVKGRVK